MANGSVTESLHPKARSFVPKFKYLADCQQWIEEQQSDAAKRWLDLEAQGKTDLTPPARAECREILQLTSDV
jgi:hypothetical protein